MRREIAGGVVRGAGGLATQYPPLPTSGWMPPVPPAPRLLCLRAAGALARFATSTMERVFHSGAKFWPTVGRADAAGAPIAQRKIAART